MSGPVDVLAVMTRIASRTPRDDDMLALDEARAAVAELIEAAERVKQQVEPLLTASGYFHVGAMEKLRHALANIGGAK